MDSKSSSLLKSPASMKSQPSDQINSRTPQKPSDQISSTTPQKFPHSPPSIKYRRHSTRLPEKYEILLRFFDALDASLKLLRLRKAIPVFSKIRVMIENMSERRFTHQHLAKLKFLLPEIGIRKVLMADEETRCMKNDLHVTLDVSRMAHADKRKRRSKLLCLRDRFISRISEFVRNHPEGTEIPEDKLPEPFNQQKHDLLLNIVKQSNSCSHMQNCSGVVVEQQTAQASHLSPSFRKHFSKRGSDNESMNNSQTPTESLHQLPSIPDFNPSADNYEMESGALIPEMVPYRPPEGQITCKPLVDGEFCSIQAAQEKQGTPTKSAATPIKPVTPILQTPKRVKLSRDKSSVSLACKASDRPSCARSLQFEDTSKNAHIELQVDDAECSNINDILPDNLLQSLMEKEKRIVELAKRKQMTKSLPKLFDRIYFLYQNPKSSAIRKGALIRYLTECHLDITDESEIEEQLKLLQEIIPEWIICKLSPSGKILYSINKALNPNTLRLTLNDAM